MIYKFILTYFRIKVILIILLGTIIPPRLMAQKFIFANEDIKLTFEIMQVMSDSIKISFHIRNNTQQSFFIPKSHYFHYRKSKSNDFLALEFGMDIKRFREHDSYIQEIKPSGELKLYNNLPLPINKKFLLKINIGFHLLKTESNRKYETTRDVDQGVHKWFEYLLPFYLND